MLPQTESLGGIFTRTLLIPGGRLAPHLATPDPGQYTTGIASCPPVRATSDSGCGYLETDKSQRCQAPVPGSTTPSSRSHYKVLLALVGSTKYNPTKDSLSERLHIY